MSKNWPRLTETLTGPRFHGVCSGCGCAPSALVDLTLWQECDENDKPEARFIWLCKRCDSLVGPHVRLYERLHPWSPAPGAMALCIGCKHRKYLDCTNPKSLWNGGLGMVVTAGKSTIAFFDGTRNGKKTGWREVFYSTPPQSCNGFTPLFETVVELQPQIEEVEL